MVFILGINFPERQLVRKALTSLYGISRNSTALKARPEHVAPADGSPSAARSSLLGRLMAKHYIHPRAKLGELSDTTVSALTASLTELTIENDLKRKIVENITRLRDMGSYRGRRHAMGLPVRGQNTRSQIKTAWKLNRIERWR